VNNFNWELRTSPSAFPSWLSFSSGWAESNQFALTFNATELRKANPVKNPDPFVFQLAGTVYYTHGPERFVEQEDRVLNLVAHLNLEKTPAQRSDTLLSHFSFDSFNEQTGVTTYRVKSSNENIPNLVTEAYETLVFECGGTVDDTTGACQLGAQTSSPVFIGENSMIHVKSGVLLARGSIACWGKIKIDEGAALVFEGDSNDALFSINSDDLSPLVENNGIIRVKKGVFRIIGSPVTGKGRVNVDASSKFEFDPRQESNFGNPGAATNNCVSVYNLGDFDILSGRTRFTCSVISIGLGFINIGMSAVVSLDGNALHVLGGYHDGNDFVSDLPGVNAIGTISSGHLTVAKNAMLRVGAGMRLQGLGFLESLENSNVTVAIEWYDPETQPDSLIIASGPATERVNVGLLNSGGRIFVKQGGFRLGTGVISTGLIKTEANTTMELTAKNAHNELGGQGLTNEGDVWLKNGAVLSFRGPLQSTGRVIATNPDSHIFFYSPVASTIANPATGTSLTKAFGLFTPGALHVIDNSRLQILGTMDNKDENSRLWPRFFVNNFNNAGGVLLSQNATVEVVNYTQKATAPLVGVSTIPIYNPTGVNLKSGASAPFTSYSDKTSSIKLVPEDRYSITDAGVITETPIPENWNATQPNIQAGAFGTMMSNFPSAQSAAPSLTSGTSLLFAAICVVLAFLYQF